MLANKGFSNKICLGINYLFYSVTCKSIYTFYVMRFRFLKFYFWLILCLGDCYGTIHCLVSEQTYKCSRGSNNDPPLTHKLSICRATRKDWEKYMKNINVVIQSWASRALVWYVESIKAFSNEIKCRTIYATPATTSTVINHKNAPQRGQTAWDWLQRSKKTARLDSISAEEKHPGMLWSSKLPGLTSY